MEQRRHRGAEVHSIVIRDLIRFSCSTRVSFSVFHKRNVHLAALLDISDFPFMREPSDRLVDDQAALS